MDFGDVFRGLLDTLTDSRCKAEWDEVIPMLGIFLIFGVIQWLMLRCRRRWIRYIPVILMTFLWILTEYMVASEPSMGAILAAVIVGYPVVLGWTGTLFACLVWHIRKIFRKTE